VYQELFTIEEAMEYLRVSRSTIYRLMREGDLPYYVLTKGRRRLKREDLDKLLVKGDAKDIEIPTE
jgi:excisionase family DNA binding protein